MIEFQWDSQNQTTYWRFLINSYAFDDFKQPQTADNILMRSWGEFIYQIGTEKKGFWIFFKSLFDRNQWQLQSKQASFAANYFGKFGFIFLTGKFGL